MICAEEVHNELKFRDITSSMATLWTTRGIMSWQCYRDINIYSSSSFRPLVFIDHKIMEFLKVFEYFNCIRLGKWNSWLDRCVWCVRSRETNLETKVETVK